MRESLKKSIADSPVKNQDRYPKGSVVLCNACAEPIFKLDRAIALGDGAGRLASAMKPLDVKDLVALGDRDDIDAGVKASVQAKTREDLVAHAQKLHEVKAGDPMLCPLCSCCFVQVLAVGKHEVLDRAYVIELLTIPPQGDGTPPPVRGRQIGADKEWVH